MWVSPNEKLPLRIQTEEATFLYSILPSGYVRIERCEGPRGVVHIPATIDGAAVSELAEIGRAHV